MVFTMKNETNLLYPPSSYWKPKKGDTVGDIYEMCDRLKRNCTVLDRDTGKRLRRCKKTAEMYVYSVDTCSIKKARTKTRDYTPDIFGNDEVAVVVAYDGVDLMWDEERKCFYVR